MRRLLYTAAILLVAACSGQPAEYTFVVDIAADPDLAWQGSAMVTKADGRSEQATVDGMGPKKLRYTGTGVSVSFQKQAEGGKLAVRILEGTQQLAGGETMSAYGLVTMTTPIPYTK